MKNLKYSAIILGAGKSARFKKDKILHLFNQIPLVSYTMIPFIKDQECQEVILVTTKARALILKKHLLHPKIKMIVVKSSHRSASAWAGLQKAASDYVLIHDGARCFINQHLINDVKKALGQYDAVVPYLKPTETMALINSQKGTLAKHLDRLQLVTLQTPQAFKKSLIIRAMENSQQNHSDDASYLDPDHHFIKLIPGYVSNYKITFATDISLLKNL